MDIKFLDVTDYLVDRNSALACVRYKGGSLMELIIVGASGHGKVAADIAKRCGYRKIMFLDDNVSLKHCMDYPVIGKLSDANKYKGKDFFVAIGDSNVRKCVQEGFIKSGYNIITLIHPKSVVADMVSIGIGTVVMAGAIINPNSKVGKGCIINTGASVDHDNGIEDYVPYFCWQPFVRKCLYRRRNMDWCRCNCK